MADRRVVEGGNRTGWLIGAIVIVAIALAAYFYWNGSFGGYGTTTTGTADGDTEIVLPAGD